VAARSKARKRALDILYEAELRGEPALGVLEARIAQAQPQVSAYAIELVRGVQARLQSKDQSLTDVEYETLLDTVLGLTDKAIAARRHISVRGVQNRLSMLLAKLVGGEDAHLRESAGMEIFNPRARVVTEALKRGLIDTDELAALDEDLEDWLAEEFDYERAT